MLLADFQMLSMTGSEAVDKYIYIPERPPDSTSIKQSQSFSHRIIKSLKSRFFHAPPSMSYKKIRHLHDSMMNTAPMQAAIHPDLALSATFNAVANRKYGHKSRLLRDSVTP